MNTLRGKETFKSFQILLDNRYLYTTHTQRLVLRLKTKKRCCDKMTISSAQSYH